MICHAPSALYCQPSAYALEPVVMRTICASGALPLVARAKPKISWPCLLKRRGAEGSHKKLQGNVLLSVLRLQT